MQHPRPAPPVVDLPRAIARRLAAGAAALLLLGLGACGSGTAHHDDPDAAADAAVLPPDGGPTGDASVVGDAAVDPDGCVPATCGANQCGALGDGCGGALDCGGCPSLGETCGGAGVPNECGAEFTILHAEPGCFHTVVDFTSTWETVVGGGVTYAWISIEYQAIHGGWRTDIFDREVLNHNLMGLTRNVTFFPGRYILGNAAQIRPAHATLDRKSLFYGRVDLEQKPPGEGYTGYTSWRTDYGWTIGETYGFHVLLDAVNAEQILQVFHNGALDITQVGDIPYFDPSLTDVAWTVQLGGEESDGREVMPIGWEFCDLLVLAEEL